jgi:gliding motility-associated lipoprotein GldJ
MIVTPDNRILGKKELDADKLVYRSETFDYKEASKRENAGKPRSQFIVKKDIKIYPDTLVWIRDFSYSYNEPMAKRYFSHPSFGNYPVVGVSWKQATAFCEWRTNYLNSFLESKKRIAESDFRLPTEAEWEYAAQAMIGTQWLEEMQTHQRVYPWDGHAVRNPYGKQMGYMLANFKRGRGDYAGIAGRLNDGALITTYIYEFPPNDYGLYNMGGNVSEWVQDVYRPMSYQDFDDLNPIRRDGFLDTDKEYNNSKRKDPDTGEWTTINPDQFTSLITDRARVYKGGSWKDVAYWMSPGTRRFLDQDSATATIGFRCAMIKAGSNY